MEWIDRQARRMIIQSLIAMEIPDLFSDLTLNINYYCEYPDSKLYQKVSHDNRNTIAQWGQWNPTATIADVSTDPNAGWDYGRLGYNNTINIELVVQCRDQPWSFDVLSGNPAISFSDVLQHPEFPWSWTGLSTNPNVTDPIILEHFDKWNWSRLSGNQAIDTDMVRHHRDWPWDWPEICSNSSVRAMEFAPVPDDCWFHLSWNRTVTIRDILCYPDRDWFWHELSQHIDVSDILHNLQFPWVFDVIGQNPTLRLEHLRELMSRLNVFTDILTHDYALDYQANYRMLARRHLAAMKIQLFWRHCRSNPLYLICHKLQDKELMRVK